MTFLDRIKETSTSTGTGTFTLGGAVLGYKVFTNGTYKYCIVNETESEWEVGEGTVASGVLTRTTIEASSNGGAAVVFTAGTKYVFNTVSAAYVNSLVPYTGATANVNIGAYNITATNIIRAGGLATEFLKADGSIDSTTYMNRAIYDTDGNGVVDAAEKMQTIGRNSTGATLYKGTIVYISGSTGNRPNFVKAQANSEATSAGTFGVVVSDIANNADGYVATIGTLSDLDTRTTATNPFTSVTLADGDTIYLDPNTAGYVTNVKPSAPNHIVYVGKVVRTSPTLGTIVYRIQNGYELSEIHDVSISSVANNDVLVYESSSTLWKNKSIATILGYTPADDSLVVHLAGAENITGVKTFQNAIKTTTGNNLLNTGGGNTVIGYTADPATSTLYKLDVNGKTKTATLLVNDGGTYSIEYNASTTNGKLLSKGSYPSFTLQTAAGQNRVNIENGGPNAAIQMWYGTQSNIYLDTNADGYYALGFAYGKTSAPVASAILELSSVSRGLLLPRMTTAQKTAITTPATSLMVYDTDLAAFQYYTGSAWAGLGGGGGISGSGTAGQVTYWSGTSAVTGSSNLVWDATNSRLSIAAGASPAYRLQVHGSMRVGTTAASAMYWDDTNNRLQLGSTTPTTTFQRDLVISKTAAATITAFTVFNGSTTGYAGFYIGEDNSNLAFNFKYGSAITGNWSGTSLPRANAYQIATGGTNNLQLILQGTPIVLAPGITSTNAGLRNDETSVRITTLANVHTSGTALLDVDASTTSRSSLRIRSGTAPTSPNDGDIWYDGTNIYIRVGTTTKTFTII